MPSDNCYTFFNMIFCYLKDNIVIFFLGFILGFYLYMIFYKKKINKILEQTKNITYNKLKKTKEQQKEILSEAKKEISLLKRELELDLHERKQNIIDLENKVYLREEMLNNKMLYFQKKEEEINLKEQKIKNDQIILENLEKKNKEIIIEQKKKLESIAALTEKEAYDLIMKESKNSVDKDITIYIKSQYETIKQKFHQKAKIMLCLAMQKYSYEVTSENNVHTIKIPNDKIKGHIIGKDGKNIKTLETLTGVDFIINNDSPNLISISCFNPIRREIAKRTLNVLISDGRIYPNRIEKVIENIKTELNDFIMEKGENAIFNTNIGEVDSELIFLLGQLYFRTSYGQNVLKHSIEVAFLTGKLAAEIGENESIARRAGLFHDIGKSLDHEMEGNHVEIGINIANKYNECKEVIDAISSHHEDKTPETIIAALVSIADTLSAARPGARKESLEKYVKRLKQLEQIADEIEGVDKSYAIQAGREIRVIVKSDCINDFNTFIIAKLIKEKISKDLFYKGVIKITVIRELRVIEKVKL